MTRGSLRLLGTLVLAALLSASAVARQPSERPLRNVHLSLFSVQYEGGVRTESLLPRNGVIPYRVQDSCYEWRLTFAPQDRQIELDEVLLIPAAATEWGDNGKTVVADDLMSSHTPRLVSGHTGAASNSWCVAGGDPEGPYKLVISHDGKVLGKLTFHVLRQ